MKVQVNGNSYDVHVSKNKARVNSKDFDVRADEEQITINGKKFYIDFLEDGEPSLVIMNGIAYQVLRATPEGFSIKELKAPINGQIVDVFVDRGGHVTKGQTLVALEAMKMENQMKSPVTGLVEEVKVRKGQLVKTGEVLITFR